MRSQCVSCMYVPPRELCDWRTGVRPGRKWLHHTLPRPAAHTAELCVSVVSARRPPSYKCPKSRDGPKGKRGCATWGRRKSSSVGLGLRRKRQDHHRTARKGMVLKRTLHRVCLMEKGGVEAGACSHGPRWKGTLSRGLASKWLVVHPSAHLRGMSEGNEGFRKRPSRCFRRKVALWMENAKLKQPEQRALNPDAHHEQSAYSARHDVTRPWHD